jgi:excisionase family DNA binding protein
VTKRAYAIREFCKRFSVGRTTAYQEIKAGRLKIVKLRKRTLIPADEAEAWFQKLVDTQRGGESCHVQSRLIHQS